MTFILFIYDLYMGYAHHPYQNMSDYLQIDKDILFEWNEITHDLSAKKWPVFIDHLFSKIDSHIEAGGRTIILTMTKKSSEEITNFLITKWYKAYYLHSEISTMDRREIIKKLRTGQIDILVGINLLREGIDLPEVTLISILDADKEGFLRSTTSLIQIIGRAARNPDSEVVLYGENITESMLKALRETYRRRKIQIEHNKKHNISPSIAISNVKWLEVVRSDDDLKQWFDLVTRGKVKRLKRMTKKEKNIVINQLKTQLDEAIKVREFEQAASIRDQIREIEDM